MFVLGSRLYVCVHAPLISGLISDTQVPAIPQGDKLFGQSLSVQPGVCTRVFYRMIHLTWRDSVVAKTCGHPSVFDPMPKKNIHTGYSKQELIPCARAHFRLGVEVRK